MRTLSHPIRLVAAALMWTSGSAATGPNSPITEIELSTPANHLQAIIAAPDGTVWATACAKPKIIRLGKDGRITEFPVPGANAKLLQGITVGADGNLWFTTVALDVNGNPVAAGVGRITPDGVVTEFPVPTASIGGRTIVAGPDGNLWFTEGGANQIGRVTTAGAVTEFAIPTLGSLPECAQTFPHFEPVNF